MVKKCEFYLFIYFEVSPTSSFSSRKKKEKLLLNSIYKLFQLSVTLSGPIGAKQNQKPGSEL